MNLFIDVLERVGLAFTVAFVGALTASPIFDNLGLGWQTRSRSRHHSRPPAQVVFLALRRARTVAARSFPSSK